MTAANTWKLRPLAEVADASAAAAAAAAAAGDGCGGGGKKSRPLPHQARDLQPPPHQRYTTSQHRVKCFCL